ncbi:hypothetical protein BKA01_000034 [Pseudonocardia eucalypti]|nr:hypothetical protein [Pseudonocardia eucalypti]
MRYGGQHCQPTAAYEVEDEMPKSKVRKKAAYTQPKDKPSPAQARAAGPSHPLYVGVMLGFMVLGLIWLVVNYLAGHQIGFMVWLGGDGSGFNYNFVVGFVLIIVGLLMTMRWR